MVFTRSIKRITMNDDTSFDVEPGGVVVFVGPNNAGKSQALRNITGHFTNGKQSHEINVVSEIVWRRDRGGAAVTGVACHPRNFPADSAAMV